MKLERLEYIKNINDLSGEWAYAAYRKGAYFPLNFRAGEGVEAHAARLPKGALIILSQNYNGMRYLSHIVELANEAAEDQPQWKQEEWGIIRWVKVHWAADYLHLDSVPHDEDVMQVNWGWQDTKAKSLASQNLMARWVSLEALRTHLSQYFI